MTAKFVASEVTIYWLESVETVDEKALVLVLNDLATQGGQVVTSAGGHGVFHWTLAQDKECLTRQGKGIFHAS